MLIGIGFYSCAFASFVDEGGFAADLGRFGETTLPLGFRWALTRVGGSVGGFELLKKLLSVYL